MHLTDSRTNRFLLSSPICHERLASGTHQWNLDTPQHNQLSTLNQTDRNDHGPRTYTINPNPETPDRTHLDGIKLAGRALHQEVRAPAASGVWGLGFGVSGLGCRDSGFGSSVERLWCEVLGFGCWVSGLGVGVEGLPLEHLGLRLHLHLELEPSCARVQRLEFRFSGCMLGVECLGCRV